MLETFPSVDAYWGNVVYKGMCDARIVTPTTVLRDSHFKLFDSERNLADMRKPPVSALTIHDDSDRWITLTNELAARARIRAAAAKKAKEEDEKNGFVKKRAALNKRAEQAAIKKAAKATLAASALATLEAGAAAIIAHKLEALNNRIIPADPLSWRLPLPQSSSTYSSLFRNRILPFDGREAMLKSKLINDEDRIAAMDHEQLDSDGDIEQQLCSDYDEADEDSQSEAHSGMFNNIFQNADDEVALPVYSKPRINSYDSDEEFNESYSAVRLVHSRPPINSGDSDEEFNEAHSTVRLVHSRPRINSGDSDVIPAAKKRKVVSVVSACKSLNIGRIDSPIHNLSTVADDTICSPAEDEESNCDQSEEADQEESDCEQAEGADLVVVHAVLQKKKKKKNKKKKKKKKEKKSISNDAIDNIFSVIKNN